jgi:hypothetical protein
MTTYAALAETNVVDRNKTNVEGTAGAHVGQCDLVTNKEGSALAIGEIVKSNGTTNQVEYAQADSEANARPVGVMVTPPANNAEGYMAPIGSGVPYVKFTGAVTPDVACYLAPGTAGVATVTVPPVNSTDRKLRLGRIVTSATGAAYVSLAPQSLSELADGVEITGVPTQEISDTASTFTLAQKTIVYLTISATRAATLPALATVRVGDVYILKDLTGTPAQIINLTPNGTDNIDGVNAAVPLATGTYQSISVTKTPTGGWAII